MMVIILQYIYLSNQHVIYLKLIQCYMSTISQFKTCFKKWKKKRESKEEKQKPLKKFLKKENVLSVTLMGLAVVENKIQSVIVV